MALNEEQRKALRQLFRDIDTYCDTHPESNADEPYDAIYPLVWKWACEERIRRSQLLGHELNRLKRTGQGLGTALQTLLDNSLPLPGYVHRGTITGRIPSTPNIEHLLGFHTAAEPGLTVGDYTELETKLMTSLGVDEDNNECEGHESLDGAHMGESVYCDGSCRKGR